MRGQWVEVDREKLTEALDHWKQLEEQAEDGLSFIEGMRLLAGARATWPTTDGQGEASASGRSSTRAHGSARCLRSLRSPENLQQAQPGADVEGDLAGVSGDGRQLAVVPVESGAGRLPGRRHGPGQDDPGAGPVAGPEEAARRQSRRCWFCRPRCWPTGRRRWPASRPRCAAVFVHPVRDAQGRAGTDGRPIPARALQDTDLVLTTYGMLLRQPWLLEVDWRLVVLDEAQAIKNPAARQTKTVKRLKADARIALTGTPVENRLSDLWSLFDFLCPGLLGSQEKFKEFVKTLEAREQNRYAPLRSLVQPYILRRLKTDKRRHRRPAGQDRSPGVLRAEQASGGALRQAGSRSWPSRSKALDGMKRRGLVLAYLMRLKQLCNHPSQLLGDGPFQPDESGKFARLAEICEEIASRQEKALVFTQFREMTEPLARFLAPVFGRPGLVLHGGTAVRPAEGDRRPVPARRRPAVLRALAEGRRHGPEPDRRLARDPFRPLVEPGRGEPGHRPRLPHRPAAQRAGPQVRLPGHGRGEDRRPDRREDANWPPTCWKAAPRKLLTEMTDAELIRFVSLDIDKACE